MIRFCFLGFLILAFLAISTEARCEDYICDKSKCEGPQTREKCLEQGSDGRVYGFLENGDGICGCCSVCQKLLSK